MGLTSLLEWRRQPPRTRELLDPLRRRFLLKALMMRRGEALS